MKWTLLFTAAIAAEVSALSFPADHPPVAWKPAGPNDMRSPCPMLNALANHGHLPHDGKDISKEQTINAFGSVLNIDKEFAEALFANGMTANPKENATTFSLDDLNRHNVLEHDASLSRQDFYFGDDHRFNREVFDETRSYWTGSFIDIQSAARAHVARVNTSNTTNPTFALSDAAMTTALGESGFCIVVLGDKTAGTVQKNWVEYLFENERLPYAIGWTKAQNSISYSDFNDMTSRIKSASESSELAEQSCKTLDDYGLQLYLI
ncbi:hypothetical protein N7532_010843 [Penicillium argentinense]|uniref:Heme haloperoxidase family profile domain-containing protein n=1 Tax=Penicillium argentinense TaxID=1131581 RepID=A0A9W9JYY1_9EURO|nr:uncharacterized protein N7532_010843 [Penicillium argentinense]KAJ5086072.1 hypothetical protein N7532_010843 [Penicillium argentinense]